MNDSPIRFRICIEENFKFIEREFIEKMNQDSLEYLGSIGVKAELLPMPQRGGGGLDIGLLLKILGVMKGAGVFFKNLILRRAEREVDLMAPRFSIYLTFNVEGYPLAVCDSLPGEQQKVLIFTAWSLKEHFSQKYPGYRFELWSHVQYPSYDYSLWVGLSNVSIKKSDVGLLMRFIAPAQIKSRVNEHVTCGESMLIKHTISYLDEEKRLQGMTKLYYLKFDKIVNFSLRVRGVKKTVQAKRGVIYEIVERKRKLRPFPAGVPWRQRVRKG